VQRLAPALEQILVGRVLDQGVFEAVIGLRRQTPRQQDVRLGEPVQRRLQRRVVHPGQRT
jgi:hypothetical protein